MKNQDTNGPVPIETKKLDDRQAWVMPELTEVDFGQTSAGNGPINQFDGIGYSGLPA